MEGTGRHEGVVPGGGVMMEGGSWWEKVVPGGGHGDGRVMAGHPEGKAFSGVDAQFCPEVFSVKEGTWIVCL